MKNKMVRQWRLVMADSPLSRFKIFDEKMMMIKMMRMSRGIFFSGFSLGNSYVLVVAT